LNIWSGYSFSQLFLEACIGKDIRADYNQMFLLPPSLEDWVGPDHPARFIRDFVASIDFRRLGFRVPELSMGRLPYSADLLLSVWLYGYLNRIRSSRQLERACQEHVSLLWLTGFKMNKLPGYI
jgi:transposase